MPLQPSGIHGQLQIIHTRSGTFRDGPMLLLRTLILTLFISVPAYASGLNTEQSVFELSVNVKTLLLKYYHVQADEGNPQLVAELLNHRQHVSEQQASVLKQLGSEYGNFQIGISEHWIEFNRLLDQNIKEVRESNYPELQVVTLMRASQRALLSELDQLSESILLDNEVSLNELDLWQRRQKGLMLDVVERYIERAASSMGAPLTIDEVDIAVVCKQFERGITELQGKTTSQEAQQQLTKIRSQWLFIERAATDNDARLVPFLVMRYTHTILGRLDSIENFI